MLRCIKNTIFSSHYPPIVATAPYLFVHTRNEFDYRINDRVSDHRTTRNLKKSFSNFSPQTSAAYAPIFQPYISPRFPSLCLSLPPFLQFLNIDRISLTNIRLARSDGDFLTKSCCKIHIYIYIRYTFWLSRVGRGTKKWVETARSNVRAWIMQENTRLHHRNGTGYSRRRRFCWA